MKYKSLDDGFQLPILGLGTWGIGGFMQADFTHNKSEIQAIKDAIILGYLHIDTAEVYGAGHTEEIIGEAIKDFDRSQLIITSKVAKGHLHYNDVITACKSSLQRLQTEYIDIYLIHAPNPEIPLEETMSALDYLVDQQLVRHIGVSNFSVEQMKEAQKLSKHKIVCNEIPYNLSARNYDYKGNCTAMESKIVPYCQQNNIIIIAYRPVERGFLLQSHPILDSLSKKYNRNKAEIAINWLISQKNIVTITKAIHMDHLKENLKAIDWALDDKDIQLLNITEFGIPTE